LDSATVSLAGGRGGADNKKG